MRLKLICCEVFLREICHIIADAKNTVDPEFTPKGSHEFPQHLKNIIQEKINAADATGEYDAIILGFGLCGNATEGLKAGKIPLIIPRAHDCCTILLGSRKRFIENFWDNLSAEWSSVGYMERGTSDFRESSTGKMLGSDKSYEEFVELYGEENAKYIWETLHPNTGEGKELIFIETPETAHLGYLDRIKEIAGKEKRPLRVIQGDTRLLRGLVEGSWDEAEYLIVPPGKQIKAVYDHETVITV